MAFTALAAGVSGLQAFTEGVGVIADNITNVNTIGYKETRSRFSTLVTETAALSSYSPGGVRAFSQTLVSKQGLLQPSGSQTDLSIDGAGFFVVRNADTANDPDGEFIYTRAGAFTQDADGFFQNTAGHYLMGWPLDSAGNIPSNQNDLTELEPININTLNGFGDATSAVALRANLQASTSVFGGTYAAGDMAAGTTTPDFETNLQIFDSLGRSHTVVFSALKTGTNSWDYELTFDDASVLDGGTHTNGLIGDGTLEFNPDGTLDLGSSSLNDVFAGGAVTLPDGNLTFDFDDTGDVEVAPGSINFNFGTDGEANGFSQFDSISTLISSSADGASFDNVNGVSIGEDGVVTALFDNGLALDVFQLPVAIFQNPDGLTRRQGNAFGISDFSGDFALQQAGSGGAGNVAPNSLEQSTVDLANEFSELIKVQRAFSASTRIITTSDEILEELTRL
ncbi:MAG: flagellar hook protein FlgE [Kordiimonadaceae bacterium]|nr:flagellar hook protein FlgE [Kordiimonadaceae bacterium]MBO6569240.1 flagellar hook protein FlgE [Kordiimonadaceae bacterium]MBO6964716.1 flagellar hook protein FlgE [Kordiimonadaceae bacterium]